MKPIWSVQGIFYGRTFCKRRFASVATAKKGGGHIIAQNIFLYLHRYQVPQECLFLWDCYQHQHWVFYKFVKKNLDLGLSIPFWAKFQPPIGELYRLELNINSFLQTWACSFMSCQFYLRSIKEATKEIGKI